MILCAATGWSQNAVKGKIIYARDGKPAPFASVKLTTASNGIVSDAMGNFSLVVRNLKHADTILITSVGYENLKVPVRQALQQNEFKLQEAQKTMDAVVIKSFSKEEIAGAKTEAVGYFRSWNTENKKGEIGRTFLPGHKEYQVAKVRFKVYNTYDTCIIRLHVREVTNGQPGRELLTDSVAQIIRKSTAAEKPYEFDLNKYNLILSQKNIFVSFEVLDGSKLDKDRSSLSFVGSEEGTYYYKSTENDNWHSSDEYTIYMKLLLRYDD
ncbi:carboxypeptidase-like regulatory domain-containing protein [Ferruginibacter sp.]